MNFKDMLDELSNLSIDKQAGETFISEPLTEAYNKMTTQLKKINTHQQDIELQVEELYNDLLSRNENSSLFSTIIGLLDDIDNFINFARSSNINGLEEQAQMMWRSAIKKAMAAGLNLLETDTDLPDTDIHQIIATETDNTKPDGVILKTIRRGYIYNGEIIRKPQIIINKLNNETGENIL